MDPIQSIGSICDELASLEASYNGANRNLVLNKVTLDVIRRLQLALTAELDKLEGQDREFFIGDEGINRLVSQLAELRDMLNAYLLRDPSLDFTHEHKVQELAKRIPFLITNIDKTLLSMIERFKVLENAGDSLSDHKRELLRLQLNIFRQPEVAEILLTNWKIVENMKRIFAILGMDGEKDIYHSEANEIHYMALVWELLDLFSEFFASKVSDADVEQIKKDIYSSRGLGKNDPNPLLLEDLSVFNQEVHKLHSIANTVNAKSLEDAVVLISIILVSGYGYHASAFEYLPKLRAFIRSKSDLALFTEYCKTLLKIDRPIPAQACMVIFPDSMRYLSREEALDCLLRFAESLKQRFGIFTRMYLTLKEHILSKSDFLALYNLAIGLESITVHEPMKVMKSEILNRLYHTPVFTESEELFTYYTCFVVNEMLRRQLIARLDEIPLLLSQASNPRFRSHDMVLINSGDLRNNRWGHIWFATKLGYLVEPIPGENNQLLLSLDTELELFIEDDKRYFSLAGLATMNILTVHVADAYAGGMASQDHASRKDPFNNIVNCMKKEGGFMLSASTICPRYKCSLVVRNDDMIPGSIGVVFGDGYIVEAYTQDSSSVSDVLTGKTRTSGMVGVATRIAVESDRQYNELLIRKWTVGGVFYTTGTKSLPKAIEQLRQIALTYSKPIYEIDNINRTWKVVWSP